MLFVSKYDIHININTSYYIQHQETTEGLLIGRINMEVKAITFIYIAYI